MSLHWIFDPPPLSGAKEGGNASLHVFKSNLESLVRETLQNIRDQRVGGTVRARYTLEKLDGAAKTAFLEAIGWTDLRPHVEGAANGGYAQVSHRVLDGLTAITSNEPLYILRIDDMGTNGLIGDEDDSNANFNALCRNTLTSKDSGDRGGSYGLGKAVLWSFSSILTVLFSSQIYTPTQIGFRFFGRTELPYHEVGMNRYRGAGWFGLPDPALNGGRAISAWDDVVADRAIPARLARTPEMSTGTSILVVGFREPNHEFVRPVKTVIQEIADQAVRWFWPAIERGELQVEVEARENGVTVFKQPVELTELVSPYAQAVASESISQPPLTPGSVAEVQLKVEVPAKKPTPSQPGMNAITASARLRVRLSESASGKAELVNRIALTRGTGMVVEYRPTRSSTGDRAFHAVLLAGLAHGNSEADQALEAFLRSAEPPAHDQWEVTPRLRSEYKPGFKKALDTLVDDIDKALRSLFEERAADDSPGPAALQKLFHVNSPDGPGSKGGTSGKPTVKSTGASFDGNVWQFEGQVKRGAGAARPWSVRVETRLAGETGQGDPLEIGSMEATAGTVDGNGAERTIVLPATVDEVYFEGRSVDVAAAVGADVARRTRINLDVRGAAGGGA